MVMDVRSENGGDPEMTPENAVTVYWRPGCPYCARLRLGLRRAGLAAQEVNIWADPAAARVVRRAAAGNETVPTVMIGSRPLVNPSTSEVLAAARQAGVTLSEKPPRAGRVIGLVRRVLRVRPS